MRLTGIPENSFGRGIKGLPGTLGDSLTRSPHNILSGPREGSAGTFVPFSQRNEDVHWMWFFLCIDLGHVGR